MKRKNYKIFESFIVTMHKVVVSIQRKNGQDPISLDDLWDVAGNAVKRCWPNASDEKISPEEWDHWVESILFDLKLPTEDIEFLQKLMRERRSQK